MAAGASGEGFKQGGLGGLFKPPKGTFEVTWKTLFSLCLPLWLTTGGGQSWGGKGRQ